MGGGGASWMGAGLGPGVPGRGWQHQRSRGATHILPRLEMHVRGSVL